MYQVQLLPLANAWLLGLPKVSAQKDGMEGTRAKKFPSSVKVLSQK